MPLYDYECQVHGVFEAFNPMVKSQDPKACALCGLLSKRLVNAPNLKILSPKISNAMERNERSRHSPHVCRTGCNHGSPTAKQKPQGEPQKPKLQSYQGKRPWVIEHA